MEAKPFYKSKTFWFMAGTLLVGLGNETAALIEVLDPEVAADVRVFLTFLASIGGLILRMITAAPVRFK